MSWGMSFLRTRRGLHEGVKHGTLFTASTENINVLELDTAWRPSYAPAWMQILEENQAETHSDGCLTRVRV